MSEESKEAFLDRWSRRKREQASEDVQQEAPPPAAQPAEDKPTAPLQAIEELKPDSDFKPFMDPRVDAGTRRSALKKLFANAHFNAIDPFEPYSIDLTGEDPIPEEMLKNLNHAKRLIFDKPKEAVEAQSQAEAETQAPTQPQAQETDPENVAGKQDA
jgi:hypothetical protein